MSDNAHFIKGKELMKNREYKAAVDAFTEAIQVEESPFIYCERGVAYYHLKLYNRALGDMDHAVKLQPDYPYRYASRAYIRGATGDAQGAVDDYKKAVELDPEDAISYNNLGLMEEKLGYAKEAKQHFNKADELAPENELFQSIFTDQEEAPQLGQGHTEQDTTHLRVMLDVFRKKETFREFMQFVKKGFKR